MPPGARTWSRVVGVGIGAPRRPSPGLAEIPSPAPPPRRRAVPRTSPGRPPRRETEQPIPTIAIGSRSRSSISRSRCRASYRSAVADFNSRAGSSSSAIQTSQASAELGQRSPLWSEITRLTVPTLSLRVSRFGVGILEHFRDNQPRSSGLTLQCAKREVVPVQRSAVDQPLTRDPKVC